MKVRAQKLVSILCLFALLMSLVPLTVSAAGTDTISKAGGWLESAYVEWPVNTAYDAYHVYVAPAGSSPSWTKLDDELVRQYSGSMRADALGLKAGDYQMKVVPVVGSAEQPDKAMTTETLSVAAHVREGYAFVGKDTVGAYNADGTLKSGATVLYVTEENKDSVTLADGKNQTQTGIANIIAHCVKYGCTCPRFTT